MATRKPLVVSSGIKSQIQSGDYLDPTSLGSGTTAAETVLRGNNTWTTVPEFYTSDTAGVPTSPNPGDRWLNTDDGIEYTYVDDGDSSQWVDLGNPAQIATVVNPTYIQNAQPADISPYFWIQTGLGDDGNGISLWINI